MDTVPNTDLQAQYLAATGDGYQPRHAYDDVQAAAVTDVIAVPGRAQQDPGPHSYDAACPVMLPTTLAKAGDVVHEHDWLLHITEAGTDVMGAYITVLEFGAMHLHLGDVLDIDTQPVEGAL